MTKSAPILSQNTDNFMKEFFPSKIKSKQKTSATQYAEDESCIQAFVKELENHKAFHVITKRKCIQPGATEPTSRAKAESFLNRHHISKEIASAVVDQQILKKANYKRDVLKKRVIPPLPPVNQEKHHTKRKKPELEKKLLNSLVISNLKQQEGNELSSLPGMGVASYPPLFFNEDGVPLINSNKGAYKKLLVNRYGTHDFLSDSSETSQDTAIFINAMQTLQVAPIYGMITFRYYADFLIQKKFMKYLEQSGEIHIIFDRPTARGFNLKHNVHDKRDSRTKEVPVLVESKILDRTPIPVKASNWSSFLAKSENEQKLVEYVGERLMDLVGTLPKDQSVILGGCTQENKTYKIENGKIMEEESLLCFHDEASTRLLAHAVQSQKSRLQFVASDGDIIAIILLNWSHFSSKTGLLEQSDCFNLLHVNELVEAMNEDRDQDLMVLKQRGNVAMTTFFGVLHPLIGSDILASPRNFGPNHILRACIDFASYLFEGESSIHLLADKESINQDAYARFILALFKKQYANKIKLIAEEIFSSEAKLTQVLEDVRKDTWIYSLENNSILPSQECLQLRSLNLSFQLQVWTQATKTKIEVPNPLDYGWEILEDGSYGVIPDSPGNMKKQANIFKAIMRKCKCKLSTCKDSRCVCRKDGNLCSSFCECQNCTNVKESTSAKENDTMDDFAF